MDTISVDFETALLDGTPSVEFYRDDFRVVSASLAWRTTDGVVSQFFQGEDAVREALSTLPSNATVIVHNAQFEIGVWKARFPSIPIPTIVDTMRLVQVADNGGNEATNDEEVFFQGDDEVAEIKTGLGLQASISRWLSPEFHNHKEPFYAYIRDLGIKSGHEGSNLHLLSPEQLAAYNNADAENTLRLYEALVDHFNSKRYDYRRDHILYLSSVHLVAGGKGHGIKVDRDKLVQNIAAVRKEIEGIYSAFTGRFSKEIAQIEQENLDAIINSYKTEKGKISALERCKIHEFHRFNINSVKQKHRLFVEILGITPQFFTPKGGTAFGKNFLGQFGEGGLMLQKRGTLMIALAQMESLLELSEYTGRWHQDLRAAGTRTGRLSGGYHE